MTRWPPETGVVEEEDLETLPAAVGRYLKTVGVVGGPIPDEMTISESGRLRGTRSGRWRSVTAEQTLHSDPPGFVWSARADFLPYLRLRVIDSYENGEGRLGVEALPGVEVASETGDDVSRGALVRFLTELVWMPGAFLAPYITWKTLDEHTAQATIADGGLRVSVDFRFGDDGLVSRATAVRYKDPGGKKSALSPWAMMVGDYRRRAGGVLVPSRARAVWLLETGAFGYFEAEVTGVRLRQQAPVSTG